jgi:hypothetical protein
MKRNGTRLDTAAGSNSNRPTRPAQEHVLQDAAAEAGISRGVTRIDIRRRLLSSLRHHFCRIRLSRDAPRPELLTLQVVLRLSRLTIIDLRPDPRACVVNLAAGFQLPGPFAALVGHCNDPRCR